MTNKRRLPVTAFQMCEDPYIGSRAKSSKHHKGHMRCVRARKRLEAERKQKMAQEASDARRRLVEAAKAARRQPGVVVSEVSSEAPVQRKRKAGNKVRVQRGQKS